MEIPIPLTDQNIDTDDGIGAVVAVGILAVGFMIFAFARQAGQTMFAQANSFLANTLGYSASGENSGPGGV